MGNVEKELIKFVSDTKYRVKVLDNVYKEKDQEHLKKIKNIESECNKLVKRRTSELAKISDARWEKYANGKIRVNKTEGIIRFNNTDVAFSSIKGAELNIISGCRIVTTEHSNSKSKKHASLGGAVAGGLILGPVGAVVGGVGLGKTKTKLSGSSVSNQIPTCNHLGVLINIDGFVSEIVFISSQIDQSSSVFSKAQAEAQKLIAQLSVLAKTEVPKSFLKPEEEDSIKAIDAQIEKKKQELNEAQKEKPIYSIPDKYKLPECKNMTDEEYLKYLEETDSFRNQKREKVNVESHTKSTTNIKKVTYFVLNLVYKAVFWIFSASMLIFSIVSFTNQGILSGSIFLLTALIVNPSVRKIILKKGVCISKWLIWIILIVGFIAGVLTFPTPSDASVDSISNNVSRNEKIDCT